jgi:hypothetical protein
VTQACWAGFHERSSLLMSSSYFGHRYFKLSASPPRGGRRIGSLHSAKAKWVVRVRVRVRVRVLDAYQPHEAGGRGTCEKRMTLRNWRLVSHGVGQNPPRRWYEVEEGWICCCDWTPRRKITSSAECFFILAVGEIYFQRHCSRESGRCSGGIVGMWDGETLCHFVTIFYIYSFCGLW